MIYPQLSGEPNFVLIGVAAVFGLIIIIVMYYIVSNKRQTGNYVNNTNKINLNNKTLKTQPIPIANNGYYSSLIENKNKSSPKFNNKVSNNKQVFNVKENIYTFDDAAAVCGALGAEIATIQQLIDAHEEGGEWCNVGWTKEGIAAYPIQYEAWKKMQDNDANKRKLCGRPGINVSRNNPNLLYGVNCYGVKPKPKGTEIIKDVFISDKQRKLEQKIAEFQKNLKEIGVAPFNSNKWSA